MSHRSRKSIRLKGYDYAQPGEYFVTLCAREGASLFGRIRNGVMMLSQIGQIVQNCWIEIPVHFSETRTDILQVMPNHLHGIVEITEPLPSKKGPVGTRPPAEERRGLLPQGCLRQTCRVPTRGY